MPRDFIQFVLDREVVTLRFDGNSPWKPVTTVLNFLRSLPGHKGVKEGCAEGDCGACTLVVAENISGKLTYKALDSCLLFLPMLHGRQLITVENLASGNELHPVQRALVNHYGSQCGYCTPGMVMSLFALYKNHRNPELAVIEDALTGNLCRCTGYKSIIHAAETACQGVDEDKFTREEENVLEILDEIVTDKEVIQLETPEYKYFKPFFLTEALSLRKLYPEALVINGGTDIALRQTKKHEKLDCIIDISDVNELKEIREEENLFVVGAGASIEKAKCWSYKKLPALYEMLSVFGSLQIRNMASFGGNIASASPIGDTLPVLLAAKAKVKLQSVDNERIVEFSDFIKGYRSTDIRPDELLTSILIPVPEPDVFTKSYKISKRKHLDISSVSACFSVTLEQCKVKEIILAYGGMAASVKRAVRTEEFLTGKPWSQEQVEQAISLLLSEFSPISDARAEAGYRNQVAANLILKFYLESLNKKP